MRAKFYFILIFNFIFDVYIFGGLGWPHCATFCIFPRLHGHGPFSSPLGHRETTRAAHAQRSELGRSLF